VIGQPGFFRARFMAVRWNHALVDHILIRRERGLLTIHRWEVRPEWPCTRATAIADVKDHDVTGGSVECEPQPVLVRFVLHKAMPFVGFRLYPSDDHLAWMAWGLDMPMFRRRLKAVDHNVHEPPDADANRTAHTV
jgi:hypothetical protein